MHQGRGAAHEVDDRLAIRVRLELVLAQVLAQVAVCRNGEHGEHKAGERRTVVDLAVDGEPDGISLVGEGLRAVLEVNDGQALVGQHGVRGLVHLVAAPVRTAVPQPEHVRSRCTHARACLCESAIARLRSSDTGVACAPMMAKMPHMVLGTASAPMALG